MARLILLVSLIVVGCAHPTTIKASYGGFNIETSIGSRTSADLTANTIQLNEEHLEQPEFIIRWLWWHEAAHILTRSHNETAMDCYALERSNLNTIQLIQLLEFVATLESSDRHLGHPFRAAALLECWRKL